MVKKFLPSFRERSNTIFTVTNYMSFLISPIIRLSRSYFAFGVLFLSQFSSLAFMRAPFALLHFGRCQVAICNSLAPVRIQTELGAWEWYYLQFMYVLRTTLA